MTHLIPCPFCGGGQELRYGHTHHYVMCKKCNTRTRRFQQQEDAVGQWNGRIECVRSANGAFLIRR